MQGCGVTVQHDADKGGWDCSVDACRPRQKNSISVETRHAAQIVEQEIGKDSLGDDDAEDGAEAVDEAG
jgi:hypothetical protein